MTKKLSAIEQMNEERKQNLRQLHSYIEESLEINGVKSTSKRGQYLAHTIISTAYAFSEKFHNDPALWIACMRNDYNELVNWMD
jgi:hypothetical protein